MNLRPATKDDIEWLRTQRNRPELYKYFRQNAPITVRAQKEWWMQVGCRPGLCRLFIVQVDGRSVGYVGFNPLRMARRSAEFGIFIIPEEQGRGYGAEAMRLLLKHGFEDLHLSHIYSDVLQYPTEPDRFAFYAALGFEKNPDNCQNVYYHKTYADSQGVHRISIPSIKFFMNEEMWRRRYGASGQSVVESVREAVVTAVAPAQRRRPGRPRVHPGPND